MKKISAKVKKQISIGASAILGAVILGLIIWNFLPSKVFLIVKNTKAALANQYVEITYEKKCSSSPCSGEKVIYKGTTEKDGAICLPLKDALNVNKPQNAWEAIFEYSINTNGYQRFFDIKAINEKTFDESSNIIYVQENPITKLRTIKEN